MPATRTQTKLIVLMALVLAVPAERLPLALGLGLVQAGLLGWLMQVGGHALAPALYRFISLAINISGLLL